MWLDKSTWPWYEELSIQYTSHISEKLKSSQTLKEGWRFNEIDNLENIKYIIFVGSSVCWKSTILDFIWKELASENWWDQSLTNKQIDTYIPKRFINRERRESPDINQNTIEDNENRYCTPEEYIEGLDKWTIGINWERKLAWKTSKYWFQSFNEIKKEQNEEFRFWKWIDQDLPTRPAHIDQPRSLVLLSWNNAFYSNNDTINWFTDDDMKKILIVWVYASEETRVERIQYRSPDMNKVEAIARLKDSAENMIPHAHIYIDTTEWWDKPNQETYELMRLIADMNMKKNDFSPYKLINNEVAEIF